MEVLMARTTTKATGISSAPEVMTFRMRRAGVKAIPIGLSWMVAMVFVFPVLWMILTSFKHEHAAYTTPPSVVFEPTLHQYNRVINDGIGAYLRNSLVAAGLSTVIVLVLGFLAAYALAIRPVRRSKDVLFFFISTKMLPVVAAAVPLFIIAKNLHLLNSLVLLIILYAAMNMPIAVWMLRSFLGDIPNELIQAARVDGANFRKELLLIVFPLAAAGLAATGLLCFVFAWNEFFLAIALTATSKAATMPVYLEGFIAGERLYYARLAAVATLASAPVIVAGWLAQKRLVRGFTMGALK